MEIREIIDAFFTYVVPLIAIALSIVSLHESRKINKVQLRLNEMEEELKKYELEKIEKIEKTIRICYLNNTSAYVDFAGHIINPKDFCAVRVDGFNVQFSKN